MASEATVATGGMRGAWGAAQAQWAGFNARLGSSYLGRSLQLGAMESVGFSLHGPAFGVRGVESLGWMGLGKTPTPMGRNAWQGMMGQSKMYGQLGMKAGISDAGRFTFGRAFGGAMGLAMTAMWAYEGYQEEGWWGAAKGTGKSILFSAGVRAVGGMLGMWAAPLTIIGTAAAITYAVGEKGREHHKKLRDVEFTGSPQLLGSVYSAGAATMRQRSLLALQNTHINGRMAMGNEAFMVHTPFR